MSSQKFVIANDWTTWEGISPVSFLCEGLKNSKGAQANRSKRRIAVACWIFYCFAFEMLISWIIYYVTASIPARLFIDISILRKICYEKVFLRDSEMKLLSYLGIIDLVPVDALDSEPNRNELFAYLR